ncbi:hypothetical protein VCRA2120E57_30096 [Vibrio crassostreae]|nr:hypothetical protein VCRA2120E57_30096 [Vibrio crassostreae]
MKSIAPQAKVILVGLNFILYLYLLKD